MRWLLVSFLVLGSANASLAAPPDTTGASNAWRASGKSGAVATGGAEAGKAGLALLKQHGNAADGAAATILALTVTDSSMFCFGGEVPLIVYDAKTGSSEVICGLGAAPRLATREYFAGKGGIPGSGVEAAAVPAVVDAIVTLLDRHGTKTFAEVAQPALMLLAVGKEPWHPNLARTIQRLIDAESAAGERRAGLRAVSDRFYRGDIAHELADWSAANGGLIRYGDLATHVTRIENPTTANYHDYTVLKCGAWTQGPYLLEALQMLEPFDLKSLGHNAPQTIHVTLEAMKLALADRDCFYADPLYADVPLAKLISPGYASLRRELIDKDHASLEMRPGDPRGDKPLLDAKSARHGLGGPANDTTTCIVADAEGNVVSSTPSGWSGVVAGDTGVWLGSRLQSFNTWPDHPNCIAPGKRPRITLTPTLVLRDKKPVLAISVAGGDGQDQATLQLLIDCLDFNLSPADAVTSVRFGTDHHVGSFRQTAPRLGSLFISDKASPETIAALKAKGHKVEIMNHRPWAPSVIRVDPATHQLDAAGDPTSGRSAAAY